MNKEKEALTLESMESHEYTQEAVVMELFCQRVREVRSKELQAKEGRREGTHSCVWAGMKHDKTTNMKEMMAENINILKY